ncbi:MAG TPA: glycosyltransferase [Microbacteriaceae bacterium]|nr:glycosyltransferase [Microbacteriaceae bacterium]
MSRTLVVVPTLGRRTDYLRASLRSIRGAGDATILLVAPAAFDAGDLIAEGLADAKSDERVPGLAAAINQGFAEAGPEVDYLAWLGDDDLLRPGSIERSVAFLATHPRTVATYGACDYIGPDGEPVWVNRSGWWAAPLLRVGPDLIPQPGSVFRRSAVDAIGPLREDLGWAFDFDFFIRLSKSGRLSYLGETVAAFRWHPDSLSVRERSQSVREASEVRVAHLPRWLRPVSGLWEAPVRWATMRAAGLVKTGR